jgi:hypothetical protein
MDPLTLFGIAAAVTITSYSLFTLMKIIYERYTKRHDSENLTIRIPTQTNDLAMSS